MLPGIDGHLLSGAFIEQMLTDCVETISLATTRRTLVDWRARGAGLGPSSSPRTILQSSEPLFTALGFDPASRIEPRDTAVSATLRSGGRCVALLVTPWGEARDPLWRAAVTEAGRRDAAWCLIFNGLQLRIVDAGRLYARRHLDIDVDLAVDDPRVAAALLCLFSATALAAAAADAQSLHALVAASDRHAAGVCRSLRDGVLAASSEILRALLAHTIRRSSSPRPGAAGRGTSDVAHDSFEQALTIVYRLLFLLFAEARALVPLWHPIYRESYSLEGLRDAAEQGPHAAGLWDTLRAIARLAHTGCRAGDLQVTPFNGRLFAPARTPLAERRDLDDGAARRAIVALSTRPSADKAGCERIAYRDLGVEQLGAVYETLLDYEPRIERGSVSLEPGSGVRKATGSFYTPQPIADYLVRRTLDPLVRGASPDRILQLRIVDPAMGSGAFLVAACRFLAQAYETALVESGGCHATDIGEADRAAIRRTIAERCLYGVDLNPMAVQLARLSLWLATLAADRPLSFLDHRLQVGDSLLGAWLAQLRHPPSPRDRRQKKATLPLFDDEAMLDALRVALPVRFSLESTPTDTIAQVRAKERAFAGLQDRDTALSRWKRVAHLWCASWFAARDNAAPGSAFGSLSEVALTGGGALPPRTAGRYLDAADAVGEARRLFHWELEFPEVFFDRGGGRLPGAGFDAVIGNPPWDMIRADQGGADVRSRARLDMTPVIRFTRDAGVYTAQSDGHANRYQLFVERAIALTRRGGRLGLVLPSGLATDHGSAPLRRLLLSRCCVDALVGMDNHRGVFPIHRSVRFLLVTASAGASTSRIACRLGVDDPAVLESIGDEASDSSFPVRLSPALLERISGPDLVIPDLRTATDLAIVERAAALFRPLGSLDGWGIRFGRELNASDDRDAFRPPARATRLPVVEGKHVEPFRVLVDSVRHGISAADARRLLRSDRHERPRLAYRDVASATNRLTLIAAILPAYCVSTHTVFCLRTPLPAHRQHLLCGLFNSFVLNYLVRLRVTMHVTTGTVEQLPVPTPEMSPAACREIAGLARLLARRRDPDALARLNAIVARLYQLSAVEFEHVLGTFPLIAREERDAALHLFKQQTQR
ncbi:MAG: type restriction m6 adenine methyltransferase, Alw26I/Eco31I/Esp3I family [Acidobacteria bacterium]|nr:type restriction m6 adenine methyltransferase, Alw26I/Eco31I/Esp3I family [Acidobacteriota bacterium]